MADRRATAARLLELNVKYAELFRDIEELKEKLRQIAIADGAGFKEDFEEARFVKVSAPSESKFKGIMPVFDPAAFLALAKKRQDALIEAEVVKMEQQFTKAAKPSVSVQT